MMDNDDAEMSAHARAQIADGSVVVRKSINFFFNFQIIGCHPTELTIWFILTKHRLLTRMRILLYNVDQILEFDVFCRIHLTCYCIRLIFVSETNHSSNLQKI